MDKLKQKLKDVIPADDKNFSDSICTKYSPLLSRKIYNQYLASYGYASPTQDFAGSSIYKLSSQKPDSSWVYTVNIHESTCNCLKPRYFGIPCKHLFKVWIFLSQFNLNELFRKLLTNIDLVINDHWRLTPRQALRFDLKIPSPTLLNYSHPVSSQQNLNPLINTASVITQTITSQTSISTTSTAQTTSKATLILVTTNNPIGSSQNLQISSASKRKTPTKSPSPTRSSQNSKIRSSLKKPAFTNDALFKFIDQKQNSCSYDTILAFIAVLTAENDEIYEQIKKKAELKNLVNICDLMHQKKFLQAQEEMKNHLDSLISEKINVQYHSLTFLFRRLFGITYMILLC